MYKRFAAAVLAVSITSAAMAQDKTELIRLLDQSLGQAPEARVEAYCGQRVSNLCNKLRSEPEYRDKWLQHMDAIRADGKRVDDAIKKLNSMREVNREAMDAFLATTPRLPDGRYVMKDDKGNFFDENLKPVTAEEAAQAQGTVKSATQYRERFEIERRMAQRIIKAEQARPVVGGL